jgi:signal transduction histidine kinase/CheY-like chemotaxis protein
MYVSAKIMASIVRYLETKGIAPETILSGDVPEDTVTREELLDLGGIISWRKFILALNRGRDVLRTNEDCEAIAAYIISRSGVIVSVITRLIGGITSTAKLYNTFVNLGLRRYMPAVLMTVNTAGPQYQITVKTPEDSPDCEVFFRIGLYILQLLPNLIGLPRSVVTAEYSANLARFLVTPPPGGGLLFRIRRSLKAIFFTNAIIQNIIDLEENVQQTHESLSRAKDQLERSLDERTRQIRNMNLMLQRRLTELSQIEELSELGFFSVDMQTRTVRLSTGAEHVLGLTGTGPNFTLDSIFSAVHPDDRKEFRIAMARVSTAAPHFQFEHRVSRGDAVRIIQQKGQLVDSDGTQTLIGSVVDLTAHKANELRLIAERESALVASKNKSMFLAGMSHEIRTPMTSVLGFAELIINPKTPPEKIQPYVETILRNGRHLLVLIDDILDLSKAETGHLRFDTTRHATRVLVRTALENITSQALAKSIAIDLTFTDDVPTELITDATRFSQIINNVLGNAIKFTDKGNIKVEVSGITDDLAHPGVRIVVEDRGTGISAEFSQLLFSPYSVFDMEKKRGKTGAGLGLALARGLATAMGGDITLLSSDGDTGCKFEIKIKSMPESDNIAAPLDTFSIPINMLGEGPLLKNKNILIVEDNKDIREILSKIVRDAGAAIEIAPNGAECLKKVGQNNFDMILMDLQMPVMDGFEATERLRAAGYNRPIIVVTAYALNNERERCLKAGATDFVTKPINSDLLLKTLVRHRNQII